MYHELDGVIPHPFVYIADFPLRYTVAGFGKYFTDGVHGVTSPIQQVPDACVPSAAKHRSRLHFHLAQQQAPPGMWPLLLGRFCPEDAEPWYEYTEAPGANICYVRHGRIYTVDVNCLDGISLQTVKELVPTESNGLLRDDCDMDELWLTGTPFCMVPVVSLDGHPIGDGTPGPVFKETLAQWSKLVGVDIAGQIARWDAKLERVSR
jgi:branched-chain amino acid aminotransferase